MQATKKREEGALKGNLKTVSLVDLFELLHGSKKTGMLETIDGDVRKGVYLRSGMIVGAESSAHRDMLGQLLMRRGQFERRDLSRALSVHKKSGKLLGQVLVELELFSPLEINNALRVQVEEVIWSMFGWESSEFIFHEGRSSPTPQLTAPLNPVKLAMDAARRLEQWREIKDKLPKENAILVGSIPTEFSEQEIQVTRSEFMILILVDGQRSFKQIVSLSPCDRFTASQAIHRFVTQGLLECREPEFDLPDREGNPEFILEILTRFHREIYESVSALMFEHMGETGTEILARAFKECKSDYAVLDKVSGKDGKGIDFAKLASAVRALPKDAVLHKISLSLFALSQSYLYAVKDFLGAQMFNAEIGKLRREISPYLQSHRHHIMSYGLEDETFRLLDLK